MVRRTPHGKMYLRSENRFIYCPRFVLTSRGKEQFPKLADAGGIVVGESLNKKSWNVRFDHLKQAENYAKEFIRLLPSKAAAEGIGEQHDKA